MEGLCDKLEAKCFSSDEQLTGDECRVCLKKSTDIWQLFQPQGDIPMQIMACAAVQVEEGDGLPSIICYNCRQLLDVSYNFKCQVEKSDAQFRQMLKMKDIFHGTVVDNNKEAVGEITNTQVAETLKSAMDCITNNDDNHTSDFISDHLNDTDDSMTFEEDDNLDKKVDKQVLDISAYVESTEILVEKFEKLTESDLLPDEKREDDSDKNDPSTCQTAPKTVEKKMCYFGINGSAEGSGDAKIPGDGTQTSERGKLRDSDEEGQPVISRALRQKASHRAKTADKLDPQKNEKDSESKTKYRYVCYMCEKQFVNIDKLKNHVTNKHDSLKNNEREVEDDSYSDSGNFDVNEKSDDNEKDENKNNDSSGKAEKKKTKFSCKYCTKKFTYEKSFLTHAKRHPEYDNQEKSTNRPDETQEHPTNNESEDDDMPLEGLQCTQCGKLFATKRNLKRHILTHSGLKFNCPTCHKGFSRVDKLKEHEHSKHKNQFFTDYDEDNDTDTENENRGNGDTSTNRKKEKNKPHQCPICPKSFAHAQTLTNHMERHKRVKQPQKRFLCEVCSKCFAQSGSLVAHMRTHTGVKPYVCNVCSRAFTKSTYLQLHLRTHSGEKPYICQYCSRAFARANTLARHITMHTGEAKYHCQICMKSFRRLTSLNEHTYTHTGQRPYACKICTKRYNNAGSLYAHTKKCKAQQQSNTPVISNYPIVVDNTTADNHSSPVQDTSPMEMYTKKCDQESTGQSSLPQFIITNVESQKSISTNLIQPVNSDDTSLYSINTKQLKSFYYTTYPNL